MNEKTVAVIPARGGSKGIPHKNIVPVAGKPLIAWSIEAAERAATLHEVYVSTDSPEIADVARQYGASVISRPTELSGDAASSESALLHALDTLAANGKSAADVLVFLQCTSPLTLPEDIDGTVALLRNGHADSAMTVTPFHYFVWQLDETGNAVGINHDKRVRPRRQDRKPAYRETGAVYAMRVPGFRQFGHRFFGKTAMHIVPEERAFEVDEPADLQVVEWFLRHRSQLDTMRNLPRKVSVLVLDFDGVFTDNRVLVSEDGKEAVLCDRADGLGIDQLRRIGLPVLVLSTERNPVVAARCRKLGLECIHAVTDKREVLNTWLAANGIAWSEVVYVGNDDNDLTCLHASGCPVAVRDASSEVLSAARFVLNAAGGHGAIREIGDLIRRHLERSIL
ncbi:MAG: acylneuraminate cytidylyltransferase [Planctomycetaceae bacterium]|nr:acylneuraminate cytidylyltransferase [Planctomycetaceae bacterium]